MWFRPCANGVANAQLRQWPICEYFGCVLVWMNVLHGIVIFKIESVGWISRKWLFMKIILLSSLVGTFIFWWYYTKRIIGNYWNLRLDIDIRHQFVCLELFIYLYYPWYHDRLLCLTSYTYLIYCLNFV